MYMSMCACSALALAYCIPKYTHANVSPMRETGGGESEVEEGEKASHYTEFRHAGDRLSVQRDEEEDSSLPVRQGGSGGEEEGDGGHSPQARDALVGGAEGSGELQEGRG